MLCRFILLLVTIATSISALICYNCPLHHYDFLITPDNIPVFTQCTANVTTQKFCSLNFFSDDNGKTSKLTASPNHGVERANVSYISTGFSVPKSFDSGVSFGILYQCMTDNCNNPQMILKQILEASTIEIYKPPQLTHTIDQSSSMASIFCSIFSNFTNTDECRPPFRARRPSHVDETCSTYCVTAIKIDPVDLKTERVCSYCEQEPQERFVYIDERIHLLDKRISYSQELDYICNTSDFCNSIENIQQIRQRYKIEFDFDIFFSPNSTTMMTTASQSQGTTVMTATSQDTTMMTSTSDATRITTTIGILQYILYFSIIRLIFLE